MITGEISALAFGGHGILRHEGFVIFVPFVAIGDQVVVEVTEQHKSFAYGKVVKLLLPSSDRTNPPCPYFGTCGGCQLQHITYPKQIEHKEQCIKDAFQRVGKCSLREPPTVTAANAQWAYRRHVRLQLQPEGSGYIAGYVPYDQQGLLQVNSCPIFTDGRIIAEVQNLIHQLKAEPENTGSVTFVKATENQHLLYFQFAKKIPENAEALFKTAHALWQGVIIQAGSKELRYGNCDCYFELEGMQIAFSPQAFVQNHPEQSLNIYKQLRDEAKRLNAKKVLDLYCGIGVTSLLLAKEDINVHGVEGNPLAIGLAKQNAKHNGIDKTIFTQGDVTRILPRLLKTNPDLILINPPRDGLNPQVRSLLQRAQVPQMIYISCMPSTLARDAAAFKGSGYEIRSCRGYDMFPQTAHVETILCLHTAR